MAIDKIGSKALVDCSVAAADIAPGTITTTKLAGSITNAKLANSTVTINGTAVALGASASIAALAWQSVVVSDGSTVTTMVAGRGYFVNNTSAAGIVKLPISASAGDTVAIKDYAGNFGTNKLTIQRNGHKIQGVTNDSLIGTNRASVQLVYIDATKGWLYTNESNVADLQAPTFISATGGTVTTSGNDKIHTFTGDGNFVVASVSNASSNNKVGYLVVAGGGGGGVDCAGGGGGAGGFREGRCGPVTPYTDSPLSTSGLTVTAATFPITVGAGGAGEAGSPGPRPGVPGCAGSNSIFSTITSTGGGGGGSGANASPGGSGGGSSHANSPTAGSGNTPPVSPPQGNNGSVANSPNNPGGVDTGGGGGGAGAAAPAPSGVGTGGAGATTHITGSPVAYAGGGGGGIRTSGTAPSGGSGGGGNGAARQPPGASGTGSNGTANTGGGGGGNAGSCAANKSGPGGAGGKGIVIIRYKFQ